MDTITSILERRPRRRRRRSNKKEKKRSAAPGRRSRPPRQRRLPPAEAAARAAADPPRASFVYCLASLGPSAATYIGATVDPHHRLRQHCGELAGGAPRTQRQRAAWLRAGAADDQWYMARLVSGFPTWRAALQFEAGWKRLTRGRGLAARLHALQTLLARSAASSVGMPYAEFEARGGWPPRVEPAPLRLPDCRRPAVVCQKQQQQQQQSSSISSIGSSKDET